MNETPVNEELSADPAAHDGMQAGLERLSRPAHPALLAILGAGLLLGGFALYRSLQSQALALQTRLRAVTVSQDQSVLALNHFQALADLKSHDMERFKNSLSDMAQSNKTLFESGLSLQEEKRLLEKQWEILTTYLTLNIGLQRIFLMRGDQPLESYFLGYVPLKAFAGTPPTLPRTARVTSKERFAHPERGKSEVVNGKLQWQPPQVGSSLRSNALGEFVLFTSSRLILHGPPNNSTAHEAFPHICLGLSLEAARNLYRHSFIGSKIIFPPDRQELIQSVEPPAPVLSESTTNSSHGN